MLRTVPTLVTAPTTEPVTLNEVKAWAKIDGDYDDPLLATLITAAREYAEKYMRRALVTQSWKLTIDLPRSTLNDVLGDGWYDVPVSMLNDPLPRRIYLPYEPLQSITSVTTYDDTNTGTVYSPSNYFADTANSRLVLNEAAVWPTAMRPCASIEIVYQCGYGVSSTVPQAIKNGIKMHVQTMYDSRNICEPEKATMSLYDKYKIYGKL